VLVLGIDSATPVSTVALADSEKLVAEIFYNTQKTHSERLMPMIDNMLKEVHLQITDIDGFAVAIGPGSFTGLRIGLATIKGLAHVLQKPLVGIPTLDGLAYNVQGVSGIICPILNARKNEVYTALYNGKTMDLLTEYLAVSPEKLLEIVRETMGETYEDVIMLGDGVPLFKEFFMEKLGERLKFVSAASNLPRAAQIAQLGVEKLKNGKEDSLMNLKPYYIRKSEAEVRIQKKDAGVKNSECTGNLFSKN
jgi:tRNA threonylcarbamoyladenosine biosynthesis protein TsaB